MKARFVSKSYGQATIEYLFVLVFIVGLSFKVVSTFSDFMRESVGNLGHELSVNLSSGVCETMCYFPGYRNGNSGSQ